MYGSSREEPYLLPTGAGSARTSSTRIRHDAFHGRPRYKLRILHRVHARGIVIRRQITTPHHVARIAIEGRIGIVIRQQRQDGAARGLQAPRWTPFLFQNVEANVARAEMNVGMENLNQQQR
jgi:hypothetical protein